MADYRNSVISFGNAGLNLNEPPEAIGQFEWRKLENISVLTEGVMEARPHTDDFFASTHFDRKIWTSPTSRYTGYPNSFNIGPLVFMAYVGPLRTGEPGYLTIHEQDMISWPNEAASDAATSYGFSCFLNGIPIVENQFRQLPLNSESVPPLGNSPHPPLTTSSSVPSVVRILSSAGPLVVIIDGRWKIIPALVGLDSEDTDNLLHYSLSLDTFSTTTLNGTPTRESVDIDCVKAYRVGVRTEPYFSSLAVAVTAVTTTTTHVDGPPSGDYQYVLTYRSKITGARSPATHESTTVSTSATNGAFQLNVFNAPDPQVDSIELWRRGGNVADSWRLVTTLTDAQDGLYTGSNTAISTTYWTNYPGTTQVYTDTYGDAVVGLEERLDALLVHPFPAIDSAGESITLLDEQSDGSAAFYTGTIPMTCFGPFQGQYIFWIGDPVKKSAFYWNIASEVDLSTGDLSFNKVTDPGEELVNGFIFGGNPFVFTKRKLYALDFAGEDAEPAFSPREVPINVGLSAKNALVSTKAGVFFVNHQGVYVTYCDGGPAELLSPTLSPLFRGESVGDIPAIDWAYADDIRLCVTARDLHLFYHVTTPPGGDDPPLPQRYGWIHLVLDLGASRWSRWANQPCFRYAYELEQSEAFRVVFAPEKVINPTSDPNMWACYYDDSIRRVTDPYVGVSIARTLSWNSGAPLTDKEFGVLMLDFDPDGVDITINPRYDSDAVPGATLTTGTAGDTSGRRIKTFQLFNRTNTGVETFYRSVSFEFKWTDSGTSHPKLYQAVLLFRMDEEGIVYWELPPTSLEQGGWLHIKDSYWSLKSTAAVTLRVFTDGIYDDYVIPPTNGIREKKYIEHRPRRGKLHGFRLTSPQPFYFYGEDSGLNVKSWKSSTSYKKISPFTEAGYAQYLRQEGGT